MIGNMTLEIDPANTPFPKLEYQLLSPSGRIVETRDIESDAITRRDQIRANGGNVHIVEVTTITIMRDVP